MAAENHNPINQQAFDWVTRQEGGELSPDEVHRLDAWLAADTRHAGAYLRAQAHCDYTDKLTSINASRLPDQSAIVPAGQSQPVRKSRPLFYGIGALAAALAGVAVIAVYTNWLGNRGTTFTSEQGEVRKIGLEDGSTLLLDANSSATVRFSQTGREIDFDRGEANFAVAHDPKRPFVVRANGTTVTALGTSFTIRIDGNRTDVVVTEGTVEIASPESIKLASRLPNIPLRVSANYRAVVTTQSLPQIEPMAADAVARELAWREGQVAFNGEPLGIAAAEINRRSRTQIYIDDPDLAARPVAGIFHANDPEAFAAGAVATFSAVMERRDGEIHLLGIKQH